MIFIKFFLKELLKEKNMTLYRLSKLLGVDYSHLHKISTGGTKQISFATLDKICTALDCNIEDLLEAEKNNDFLKGGEHAKDSNSKQQRRSS